MTICIKTKVLRSDNDIALFHMTMIYDACTINLFIIINIDWRISCINMQWYNLYKVF